MTGEGMTSLSVSYEIRRQLNSMRAMKDLKSVNELLAQLIQEHKLTNLTKVTDLLGEKLSNLEGLDAEHLVQRLQLSPFKI